MIDGTNEISLSLFLLSVSGKGLAALGLVIPVSVIMLAFAWRIARRRS